MTARILITSVAETDAFKATEWWRDNRLAAPFLFEDELSEALSLLAEQPDAGRAAPRPGYPNVRKLVMRRTRYLIFYEHNIATREVIIRRIWSAVRGRPPRLSR